MNSQNQIATPTDETMNRRITAAHKNIACWWKCANTVPVLDIRLKKPDAPASLANTFWPSPEEEPDIPNVVSEQMRDVHSFVYAADANPHFLGNYGSRGTPMLLSFSLGANPRFDERTVWYPPIIEDISGFNPVLNPDNA